MIESISQALQSIAGLGTIVAAVAAMLALRETRLDRVLRERPFLAVKTGRVVSESGKDVLDDALLQNVGHGPAVDVSVALWAFGLGDLGPGFISGSDPIILPAEVIAPGESEAYSRLKVVIGLAAARTNGIGLAIRGHSEHPTSLQFDMRLVYRDRGRVWYYQDAKLVALIELYNVRARDMPGASLLGENDPTLKKLIADVSGDEFVGLGVGYIAGVEVTLGEQVALTRWLPLWSHARRAATRIRAHARRRGESFAAADD